MKYVAWPQIAAHGEWKSNRHRPVGAGLVFYYIDANRERQHKTAIFHATFTNLHKTRVRGRRSRVSAKPAHGWQSRVPVKGKTRRSARAIRLFFPGSDGLNGHGNDALGQ